MDSETKDTLLEEIDKAETDSARMTAMLMAMKAQIRCQYSSGQRIRSMDKRLAGLEARVANTLSADNPGAGRKSWRLGPLSSHNIMQIVVAIQTLIIATLAGVDLGRFFG